MPEQPVRDDDQLDRQLAELDENPRAPVDPTVRQLHAELETLAESLKGSAPPDPHEKESACRRAVDQAKTLAQEMTASLLPPTAEAPPPLPERLEHFRVLKLLGQGGMGAVYLAEDTRLSRQVALKTLKPELAANPQARERFLREARLAATIEHDHIVPIYHVGEANGMPFLAMPLLKGSSLEEMIRSARKWTPVQTVRLGVQIAEGLAAAHAKGLVHRDIKPGNLWVETTGGGRVKILDFGLARASEGDIALTQWGEILGTPAYMAPEQARGEKVDARADLYSLGVVLYRLATGQLPLQGGDIMSMLMALASSQPRPVRELAPDLPPALADLIMWLLAKDRDQRPASAREVSQTLRRIQESLTAMTPAAAQALDSATIAGTGLDTTCEWHLPQPTPPKPRRRWPLAVAAGLLLLIGGGLLLQQVILRITDREGKTRDIELKPGDRIEIVEKPAPADALPKKPPEVKIIAGNPDRKAAEYVLSIGGTVRVNDQDREFKTVAELPRDNFRLTFVGLGGTPVTDAGLAHFKDCKGLTQLHLWQTRVTDAGLAHFKDCKDLTYLNLLDCGQVTDAGLAHFKDCKGLTGLNLSYTRVTDAGLAHFKDYKGLTDLALIHTRVTDAGLAHFKDCKGLTHLYLGGAQVTDAGLAHFKDCKGLTELDLSLTRVTDAGLAHFKDCKGLRHLDLHDCGQVTDAGLAHFKDCKGLTFLNLGAAQVTDAGLAQFKDCKGLVHLDLAHTRVTDAGLAQFKDCKGLVHLDLAHTRVTDASLPLLVVEFPNLQKLQLEHARISRYGFEQLKRAMPNTQIDWSEPNRRAAEQVLALGGTIEIAEPGKAPRPLKQGDPLPDRFFQLRRVVLKDCKQPLRELPVELAELKFAEIDRLESIDLSGTPLTDVGFLASIHGLRDLVLAKTGLGNAHLAALPKVQRLVLDGNPIRGTGLAKQVDLVELSLARTSITDLTVLVLARLKGLKRLSLANTALTDDGLKHLEGLTALEHLDLSGTQVTADGVAALQKALPKCRIDK